MAPTRQDIGNRWRTKLDCSAWHAYQLPSQRTCTPFGSCTAPTGSVSLSATSSSAATTAAGVGQLTSVASGGVSNITTASVPGGNNSIAARYSGDGANLPSTSTSVHVTVKPEQSQTYVGAMAGGSFTQDQFPWDMACRSPLVSSSRVSRSGPPNRPAYAPSRRTAHHDQLVRWWYRHTESQHTNTELRRKLLPADGWASQPIEHRFLRGSITGARSWYSSARRCISRRRKLRPQSE